jgi:TRAP-type C4-dicarboxylate transport system permease small subunit
MNYIFNIIRRSVTVGAVVGAIFLIGIMVLTVAEVCVRPFGEHVVGSYELVEIFVVVTAGFALGYAALRQTHIVVRFLVSRFSPRVQAIIESFTSAIGLVLWVLIAWTAVGVMREKALLGEWTILLRIPYIPFRSIWILSLILFCLVLFMKLYKSLKAALRE